MATDRFRVVGALGVVQTLGWGSTYYLPAILAVPMARELGVSAEVIFAAFSAALVVVAMIGPLVGSRIDRFGGRGVLAASSLVFATGLGALGVAQDTVTLAAAWLILGIAMAMGLYEAAFAAVARLYGDQARGAITGITLMAGFASTICWPVSAYLETEFGWRATCHFWAGAHLLIGLPLNRFLVPAGAPGRPTAPQPTAAAAHGGAQGARRRAMVVLALVFAATWFTSTAMAAHLPRLLQDVGASPAAAIAAAALVGPAQVMGRLLEFGFLQRLSPMLSARLAAAAHPLGAAVVLMAGAPAAAVFAALHGVGNGILTIAMGTLPLAIFGASGYGLRQGLLMMPARFGQAGAPLLFALLIERWGASALLLSAALGLSSLAALLSLRVPPKAEHA